MLDAQRLRNLRKQKGLKQIDIATAINIERTTYVKYEKSGIQPPTDVVVKLANFLGTTTDYLLGNSDGLISPDKEQPPPPEVGTVEWFKQGLVKYGIVKDGENLTDAQLKILLNNVEFLAEQLKNTNE